MSAHRLTCLIAAWCALGLSGGPASGQLAVLPAQGLDFGSLTPGVPLTIAVTDAASRAEFSLTGSGRFVLTFQLPTQLVSASGKTLPISFAPSAGRLQRNSGPSFNFDPNQPSSFNLPASAGGAMIYLGGTASPGASQAPGDYTATIQLVVANAGT